MIALSHRSYTILIQMAAPRVPVTSDTFLALFELPPYYGWYCTRSDMLNHLATFRAKW